MLEEIKERVYRANLELPALGLVVFTWGNASEFDPESELFVIKPSGVSYEKLCAEDMVVCNLDGEVVEGRLHPSSDTPTHARLYQAWADSGIHGVVHTHSSWATSWAQAGRSIPCYGTTHADYFYGEIPCMRALSQTEIEGAYELETGNVIVDGFAKAKVDPVAIPATLVRNHGPFSWGKDAHEAVYHAKVLEEVACMAAHTESITEDAQKAKAPQFLQDKHYLRKHGPNAYYGQA